MEAMPTLARAVAPRLSAPRDLTACRRRRLERAIESAIAVLDALDADPDREPEEDACDAEDVPPQPHPLHAGAGDAEDGEPDDYREHSPRPSPATLARLRANLQAKRSRERGHGFVPTAVLEARSAGGAL